MFAKGSDSLLLDDVRNADGIIEGPRQEALRKTGALQSAITAAEVMNKITPADISDPQELLVRRKGLEQ